MGHGHKFESYMCQMILICFKLLAHAWHGPHYCAIKGAVGKSHRNTFQGHKSWSWLKYHQNYETKQFTDIQHRITLCPCNLKKVHHVKEKRAWMGTLWVIKYAEQTTVRLQENMVCPKSETRTVTFLTRISKWCWRNANIVLPAIQLPIDDVETKSVVRETSDKETMQVYVMLG
jgi:hypothetical protein